ncbi:hypothetical protein GRI44_08995 [Altererythrobacter confluentis]|uniref:GDT1 family protein n=1 Tax=Allopontixanthobacter confluentis TaxID=1849021 RepID=A0A6L7GH14_9SPHN|nr:hypothetical protein [Allopontixanthobacter confluentis]MXP14880.1 hypothetical protein [Allopontixanthobacter confluentis]
MPSFFLAFLAVLATSLGSRDQLLVASLAGRLGRSTGLLVTGWAVSTVSAGVMAWAGHTIGVMLAPSAKSMLVAMALLLAAAELGWKIRPFTAREPTRSLFAISAVLLARQMSDAGRFLVFAIAAAAPATPLAAALVAMGGAIGGGAALTLGWIAGDQRLAAAPLGWARKILAFALLLAAALIALSIRGLLG